MPPRRPSKANLLILCCLSFSFVSNSDNKGHRSQKEQSRRNNDNRKLRRDESNNHFSHK